jgi:hypothetical protein
VAESLMEDRYIPAECSAFPASTDTVFLFNKNDGSIHRLEKPEAELFLGLSGCATRREFFEQLDPDEDDSFEVFSEWIDHWITCGLLRSEKLFRKNYRETGHSTPAGKTAQKDEEFTKLTPAVITHNRPQNLKKWLESRIYHPHFADRQLTIMVCDDSPDKDIAQQNRIICNAAQKNYPGLITYSGLTGREQFVRRLYRSAACLGIDPAVIDFALLPAGAKCTIGANRNLALILAVTPEAGTSGKAGGETGPGKILLMSDDDMPYKFYRLPGKNPEEIVLAPPPEKQVSFFMDITQLEQTAEPFEGFDLPQRIMDLFCNPFPVENLDNVPCGMARNIETGKARIIAAEAGCAGARCYNLPQFPASRRMLNNAAFYQNEAAYTEISRNGLHISAPETTIVHSGNHLLGGTLALNMDSCIPPFFPRGREEDVSFGVLLRYCNPDHYIATLPAAVYHDPSIKKPFSNNEFRQYPINEGILNWFISRDICGSAGIGGSGGEVLRELGRRYRDRAELSSASFWDYAGTLIREHCRKRSLHTERLLELFGHKPEWWARDLLLLKTALTETMEKPFQNIPSDFQSALKLYGKLLSCWQELRNLNEKNIPEPE